MGRKDDLNQLVNLMTKALRHRIGSLVNPDEFYAGKYAKDAENIFKEAEKVLLKQHWNRYDKTKIKEQLTKKLKKELTEKEFLDNKKFEIMDKEIEKALVDFELS
ncbi:MAG: hypothetical protein KAT77_05325 [Nanoarchaeota archaeon]|nr:hypothetical protein [Nanoarchaeota archaeon]